MKLTRPNRARFGVLLGLGMLVMLVTQVLESGHFHNMAAQSPDCVYCQVGTLVAAVAASAELPALATANVMVVGRFHTEPQSLAHTATARGPPHCSS